jgi:hypothetical protein
MSLCLENVHEGQIWTHKVHGYSVYVIHLDTAGTVDGSVDLIETSESSFSNSLFFKT